MQHLSPVSASSLWPLLITLWLWHRPQSRKAGVCSPSASHSIVFLRLHQGEMRDTKGVWEFNGVREHGRDGAWISLSLWYIRFCCSAFTHEPWLQNPTMMSSFSFICRSLNLSSCGRRSLFQSGCEGRVLDKEERAGGEMEEETERG